MAVVILTWIYYAIILFVIGYGTLKVVNRLLGTERVIAGMPAIITGVAVATIYAQYFSLFYKVGMLAHLLLVAVAGIICMIYRKELLSYCEVLVKYIFSWKMGYVVILVLIFAFFTSRGEFHADTKMYHAGAIQWIEEYGVIKGLANLQAHFGYNSSYFAFAALFSMKFLIGISLHTTTGFIEAVLVIWSVLKLRYASRSRYHITNMCYVGIIFYALINVTGSMSPASDYITNFMALYFIARWADLLENDITDVHDYALICIGCVYLFTLKVSAGLLVLLVIYPAVLLVRRKEWKKIGIYVLLGITVLAPFLIRNIILSGWLIYPFGGIDLFPVDWKVPLAGLEIDSKQISVWGKCLYDVSLAEMPIREWVPIWWSKQERYHWMFLGGVAISMVIIALNTFKKLIRRYRLDGRLAVLYLAVIAGIVLWFVKAPFIRYGLAFLIALPAIAVGDSINRRQDKEGPFHIINVFLLLCVFVCMTPMIDQYVKDAGVFIKQNIREPYYIEQKEYIIGDLKTIDVDGVRVNVPKKGECIGYAPLPAAAYRGMVEKCRLRGTTIKEGFIYKGE